MQATLSKKNDATLEDIISTQSLQFFCVWYDEGVTVLQELERRERLQANGEHLAAA
jgi:hypothetical protein